MDYTCRNIVIQNMRDFHCDEETIEAFMKCFDSGNQAGQKKILDGYRKKLMTDLHKTQKEIDLLDFMVYQLEHCCCE